ncbi:MAG: putative lipid II flippase FtsW [Parachlamydiaceae bacterium]|nr:putative lipid II flippase FtsW [Parachlamydiaceae bacterium]
MLTFLRLLLILCVSSIFIMGLIMIFNTTSAEILDHSLSKSTHHALLKQIMYGGLGFLLGCCVWKLGYKRFIAWSPYLLLLFTILLALTLIPGIGKEVNGSRRWIGIGGFSFQPSEFVKYIVPTFLIYCFLPIDPSQLTLKGFLKLIGIVFIPILLILIEPNNGTAGVVSLMVVLACFLSRIKFKYWALPLVVMMTIGSISAYHLPYVTARLKVYLHPELDLQGKGHQPYQAKIAAGSGQLLGRGPGNSLQKLSYLPEAQNDYIAAIYAEEFGFLGVLGLIILYMIVAYCGFYIAYHAGNRQGFFLATLTIFLISFQAFMNLGVVSGLLPSTGLNLPFFSQGGTSLMANIFGLSLLLNISFDQNKESHASII